MTTKLTQIYDHLGNSVPFSDFVRVIDVGPQRVLMALNIADIWIQAFDANTEGALCCVPMRDFFVIHNGSMALNLDCVRLFDPETKQSAPLSQIFTYAEDGSLCIKADVLFHDGTENPPAPLAIRFDPEDPQGKFGLEGRYNTSPQV